MKKILYLLLVVAMFSCADLDNLAPINSIPTNQSIVDLASATAALNGVYDGLQDDLFDTWLSLPQYFSDEANATGTFPTRLEFGNLNVFPANGTMANAFTNLYETINDANNVIALVPNVDDTSFDETSRGNIIGQAKMVRAHCYLHLVTLWQDVPLIIEPTVEVGENLFITTNPTSEIYDQIIADLTDAANTITIETGPNTASKQAANAFLARVALYQGRWSDAMALAQGVLGADFDLTTVPYLQDQIYNLAFTSVDGNTLNFFYAPEDLGGRYSIGPSAEIIDAFEVGDERFAVTIDSSSFTTAYGLKYPSFSAGISGTAADPIYFIRHAEMVLIAAEAAAEMGDFDSANAYLNMVRARAGLEPVTMDSGNYVDHILHERFVEFAFEGPFRLIDARRRGKAEELFGPIGYDSCDDVWPLPQRDIDRNPSLTQNDCCNC